MGNDDRGSSAPVRAAPVPLSGSLTCWAAVKAILNILWLVLCGFWMALAHIVTGVALCLTIIGIPLGLADFKLAVVAIAPLGKEIVHTDDPRAN